MTRETREAPISLFTNRRTDETLSPLFVGIATVIMPLCGVAHAAERERCGLMQAILLEVVARRSLPPEWLCGLRLEVVDRGRLMAETAITLVAPGRLGAKGNWHVPARTLPIRPLPALSDDATIVLRSSSGRTWTSPLKAILTRVA